MSWQVELVVFFLEFVDIKQVDFDFVQFGWVVEGIEFKGGVLQLCNFGKVIIIGILGFMVVVEGEKIYVFFELFVYYSFIGRQCIFRCFIIDQCQVCVCFKGIVCGVFSNDIDCFGNCVVFK